MGARKYRSACPLGFSSSHLCMTDWGEGVRTITTAWMNYGGGAGTTKYVTFECWVDDDFAQVSMMRGNRLQFYKLPTHEYLWRTGDRLKKALAQPAETA